MFVPRILWWDELKAPQWFHRVLSFTMKFQCGEKIGCWSGSLTSNSAPKKLMSFRVFYFLEPSFCSISFIGHIISVKTQIKDRPRNKNPLDFWTDAIDEQKKLGLSRLVLTCPDLSRLVQEASWIVFGTTNQCTNSRRIHTLH